MKIEKRSQLHIWGEDDTIEKFVTLCRENGLIQSVQGIFALRDWIKKYQKQKEK